MKKCMTHTSIIITLIVLLIPFSAMALTVTDTFDYTEGSALAGSGSAGDGWAGAWYLPSSPPRANFTNSAGVAMGEPSAIARENRRNFATPLTITNGAPTIWLSFDMKVDFEGTLGNSSDTVGLDGAGAYGRLNALSGNLKWSLYHTSTSPYYDFSTVDVPDDMWSRVCVKLQPTGDGIATYTMWVNPNYALLENDLGQVAVLLSGTMDLGNTSIPSVVLYSTYYSSGNVRATDNLRVSNESSPFAPGFVATDSFTYPDGPLEGNGIASHGWKAGWGSFSGSEVGLLMSNNVAMSDAPHDNTSRSGRLLAESILFTNGAPSVWLSMKLKIDLSDPVASGSWDGLTMVWGAGYAEYGAFGRLGSTSSSTWSKWSIWPLNAAPWYHYSSEEIPDNVWVDFCMKYEPTGDGTGNYTMWVNPNYALGENASAPVLNSTYNHDGHTELTGVKMGSSDKGTGTTSYWDDLRIGTITPFTIFPQGTLIIIN